MEVSSGAKIILEYGRPDLNKSDFDEKVSSCLKKRKRSFKGKENRRQKSRRQISGYEAEDEGSETEGSETEGLMAGKLTRQKGRQRVQAVNAPHKVSEENLVLKLDSSKKGSERLGFDQVGDCSDKEKDRKDLVCLEGASESQKSSGSLDDQSCIKEDCSLDNQPPSATVQSSDARGVDAPLCSDEIDDELSGILDEFDNDISANLKNENEESNRSKDGRINAFAEVLEKMSLADQPS